MNDGFIPVHGGYRDLCSYRKAVIVYDATVRCCDRFVPRHGDRTRDQMIQAARSGKQNIVEGSQMSGTSKELELKLTNVARASLEELAEDYCDFLRLRALNRQPNADYETFRKGIEHEDPLIAANVILGLTRATCYLLDQQLRQLEQAFLEKGGLREAMTRARLSRRASQQRGLP